MLRRIFLSQLITVVIAASLTTCSKPAGSVTLSEAIANPEKWKGQRVVWQGTLLVDAKPEETQVMVTLAPGYIAVAKLKTPLSSGLQLGKVVVVEGAFDGVGGSLTSFRAGPDVVLLPDQSLILSDATLR